MGGPKGCNKGDQCPFLHHLPPRPFHHHPPLFNLRPPHPGWRGPPPATPAHRGPRPRAGSAKDGTGPFTPKPGPVPKQVPGFQGKRDCSETAISENKKAKPSVDLVDELRLQLAKVSKERNDIEKERDENDEMVTTLKQELEKVREEKAV